MSDTYKSATTTGAAGNSGGSRSRKRRRRRKKPTSTQKTGNGKPSTAQGPRLGMLLAEEDAKTISPSLAEDKRLANLMAWKAGKVGSAAGQAKRKQPRREAMLSPTMRRYLDPVQAKVKAVPVAPPTKPAVRRSLFGSQQSRGRHGQPKRAAQQAKHVQHRKQKSKLAAPKNVYVLKPIVPAWSPHVEVEEPAKPAAPRRDSPRKEPEELATEQIPAQVVPETPKPPLLCVSEGDGDQSEPACDKAQLGTPNSTGGLSNSSSSIGQLGDYAEPDMMLDATPAERGRGGRRMTMLNEARPVLSPDTPLHAAPQAAASSPADTQSEQSELCEEQTQLSEGHVVDEPTLVTMESQDGSGQQLPAQSSPASPPTPPTSAAAARMTRLPQRSSPLRGCGSPAREVAYATLMSVDGDLRLPESAMLDAESQGDTSTASSPTVEPHDDHSSTTLPVQEQSVDRVHEPQLRVRERVHDELSEEEEDSDGSSTSQPASPNTSPHSHSAVATAEVQEDPEYMAVDSPVRGATADVGSVSPQAAGGPPGRAYNPPAAEQGTPASSSGAGEEVVSDSSTPTQDSSDSDSDASQQQDMRPEADYAEAPVPEVVEQRAVANSPLPQEPCEPQVVDGAESAQSQAPVPSADSGCDADVASMMVFTPHIHRCGCCGYNPSSCRCDDTKSDEDHDGDYKGTDEVDFEFMCDAQTTPASVHRVPGVITATASPHLWPPARSAQASWPAGIPGPEPSAVRDGPMVLPFHIPITTPPPRNLWQCAMDALVDRFYMAIDSCIVGGMNAVQYPLVICIAIWRRLPASLRRVVGALLNLLKLVHDTLWRLGRRTPRGQPLP